MSRIIERPVPVTLRELTGPDLANGFLETLASLSETGLTPEAAAEVLRSRLRGGVRTYVALLGGRVVGTASLLLEQKFLHGGGWVGHVEDVAVHRDHQQRGVGSALVQHVTDEA